MKESASHPNVIELRRVHTRLGGTQIHEDINMAIRANEVTALVGGSGTGKSTLLRAMLMLLRPTSGSIKVLGQELAAIDDQGLHLLRRRIGMLFQYSALFSGMTILENIAFPFKEHTDLSPKMIRELSCLKLGLVGLAAEVGAKYPSELSGGMRKRAGLARALALDPELLFLDEPTSGLDPVSASALDDLILELQHSLALTVLMVTHDLDSIWKMADRVAMLGRGTLVAFGGLKEVAASPDPLVRSFFHGDRGPKNG